MLLQMCKILGEWMVKKFLTKINISKNQNMVYIWFTLFGLFDVILLIIKYLIKWWVCIEINPFI
jgi:hypothetical protein